MGKLFDTFFGTEEERRVQAERNRQIREAQAERNRQATEEYNKRLKQQQRLSSIYQRIMVLLQSLQSSGYTNEEIIHAFEQATLDMKGRML